MADWIRVRGVKGEYIRVEIEGFATIAQASRSFFLVKDSKGLRRMDGFKRSRLFAVRPGTLIQRVYVTGSGNKMPSKAVLVGEDGIEEVGEDLLEQWELKEEIWRLLSA